MKREPDSSPAFLGFNKAEVFLKLSALLTGVGDLDPVLSEEYQNKLEEKFGAEIERLCELYYQVIGQPDPVDVSEFAERLRTLLALRLDEREPEAA